MKIKKMVATFGKLDGAVLTPGDGLTLIQAPNEGGKSTWNAFLRAMLYGFPPRDRDRAGYLAEKNHYQPWSGAAMEGTMEVEWQGRAVTITRGPRGGQPWCAFRAVFTASQEQVPGMTGENCGELLLGISREVFERTAFVGQDAIALTPNAELEKRVAALAGSGEELISFTQVERRLKDWINRRRSNSRTGLIPQLEEELSQVNAKRAGLSALLLRCQEAQRNLELCQQRADELEHQQRAMSHRQREEALVRRDQARAQRDRAAMAMANVPPAEALRAAQGEVSLLSRLRVELAETDRELDSLRTEARDAKEKAETDPYFEGLDRDRAGDRAEQDNQEVKRLSSGHHGWLLSMLGLLLGGLAGWLLSRFGVLAIPETLPSWMPIVSGAATGCLLLSLVELFCHRSRQKKALDILERYDADTAEEIYDRADDYDRVAAVAREKAEGLKTVEERRRALAKRQEEGLDKLLELVQPFAPEAADLAGVTEALDRALRQGETLDLARARLEGAQQLLDALPETEAVETAADLSQVDAQELSAQLAAVRRNLDRAREESARLSGQLTAMGDPASLDSRESTVREDLDRRRGELAALEIAMESLRHADSVLRERFSPVLNERAGEYLSALTGGKYEAAALTRQFQALARETGESVHRQDLSLSGGTAQQLYLALRLALCDLVLPDQGTCPIFLDDALDAFDDKRAALALDCLLKVAAEGRQVLLFTCHRREAEMLSGKPVTLQRTN